MQSNTPPSLSQVSDSPVAEPRRTKRFGPPDAGSPGAAIVAIVATVVLFITVLVSQQISVQKLGEARPDPSATSETSIFHLYAKAFTKGFGTVFTGEQRSAQSMQPVVTAINDLAYTPKEKLQAAISEAELAGAQTAVVAIEDSAAWVENKVRENKSDPNKGFELQAKDRDEFYENRELLLRHYRSKLPAQNDFKSAPKPLTDAEVATLKQRLGWFGRLAAVYGDSAAPDRKALLAGGAGIIVLTVILGAGVAFAVLAGITLFIIAVVMLVSGRITPKFVPPAPGGSVYIETLAVFVLGFVLLKVVVTVLSMSFTPKGEVSPEWIGGLQLVLQWLLALIPFYPLLRGVSFPQWREQIGFVAPKGVAREIGVGMLAYFAGLPIFFLGVVITLVLKLVWEAVKSQFGGESAGPATNPIFEEILSSNPINLILLVGLATIWAPFVEEMIFRGAFFRHVRSRVGLLLAAVLTAIVFGGMHGYELVLLGPVISLGVVFALMREWRGSIIPSITAHMLHNGTIITMAILMIKLISM